MRKATSQIDASGAGLYVHIPFCEKKCRYCAFYSEPMAAHNTATLIPALLAELAGYDTLHIDTVYIGGGSPTCLPQPLLRDLIRGLRRACPQAEECTLECNPSQTTPERLRQFHDLGINRLSFGVQSFIPRELRFLGRSHTADRACRAIQEAQHAGFTNVGLDLIFAIPDSTPSSWKRNLTRAVDLGVQHIAAYSLTYEPNTPLDRARRLGTVTPIDEDMDLAMYETAIDSLQHAGYEHYEISNFSRPGFACCHNCGTWRNAPYLGIGPGAASYWQGLRRRNLADIEGYLHCIQHQTPPWCEVARPNPVDRTCEAAVLNLRMLVGIEPNEFSQRTGMDFWRTFGPVVRRYLNQGLLQCSDQRIHLTRRALPIANSVLCDFSAL